MRNTVQYSVCNLANLPSWQTDGRFLSQWKHGNAVRSAQGLTGILWSSTMFSKGSLCTKQTPSGMTVSSTKYHEIWMRNSSQHWGDSRYLCSTGICRFVSIWYLMRSGHDATLTLNVSACQSSLKQAAASIWNTVAHDKCLCASSSIQRIRKAFSEGKSFYVEVCSLALRDYSSFGEWLWESHGAHVEHKFFDIN